MNIITVNVGQGALAMVRHQKEAIIVDCRIPASDDRTYVKEIMALSLKDHCVRGLILTGFDDDHSEIVGASIVLRKYRPDWAMYPTYYKDSDEANRVFALINSEVKTRSTSGNPLKKVSVRVDQLANRRLRGLSDKFDFELFSPHIEDMDYSNNCSIVLKLTGLGLRGFSYLITGDREPALGDDQQAVRQLAQIARSCRAPSRVQERDAPGIAAQHRPTHGVDQRRCGQPIRPPASAGCAGVPPGCEACLLDQHGGWRFAAHPTRRQGDNHELDPAPQRPQANVA
jgi:hypothetical protein